MSWDRPHWLGQAFQIFILHAISPPQTPLLSQSLSQRILSPNLENKALSRCPSCPRQKGKGRREKTTKRRSVYSSVYSFVKEEGQWKRSTEPVPVIWW